MISVIQLSIMNAVNNTLESTTCFFNYLQVYNSIYKYKKLINISTYMPLMSHTIEETSLLKFKKVAKET